MVVVKHESGTHTAQSEMSGESKVQLPTLLQRGQSLHVELKSVIQESHFLSGVEVIGKLFTFGLDKESRDTLWCNQVYAPESTCKFRITI